MYLYTHCLIFRPLHVLVTARQEYVRTSLFREKTASLCLRRDIRGFRNAGIDRRRVDERRLPPRIPKRVDSRLN